MNANVRRVGLGIVVLFLAVAAQLSYLQVRRADDLANHPGNIRIFLRDITRARGPIITADDETVAQSDPVTDEFELQRSYPFAGLFAHVVGYQSILFGNSGIEATYNDELVGRDFEIAFGNFSDILSGVDPEGRVVLTLTLQAQETARTALANRRGSVVVLDVATGGVVAMYSNPTYDANFLASHDLDAVRKIQAALIQSPDNPELPRAWRERYAPGSTFKVITTALALDGAVATPDREFERRKEIALPLTDRTISNFGGKECGGTLAESFRVSCNTTFAQLGLELGEGLAQGVERFGLDSTPREDPEDPTSERPCKLRPPSDLSPRPACSTGPERGTFELNKPLFAQAAIGQGEVSVTPLQMAMIAGAVANKGVMMRPYVVERIEGPDREVVDRTRPKPWRESMSEATAVAIRQMMVDVVQNGTGRNAQIPGVQVAGKTGTAQAPGGPPHAWFIGFAPADAPQYAIAVLVERGGDLGSEATGGRVAAPIAAQVLTTLLNG